MAKSKVTIEFKPGFPMVQGDVINIRVRRIDLLSDMFMLETFSISLPDPRPPQWTQIAVEAPIDDLALRPVIQGLHYGIAVHDDYIGRGVVTFNRIGAKIIIEAVAECKIDTDCVEYIAGTSSGTAQVVTYTDCDGNQQSFSFGGVSGQDQETFFAKKGSVTSSSGVQVYETGEVIQMTAFTKFEIIEAPDVSKVVITITNNLCDGVVDDNEGVAVFTEADSDPCNFIKTCITTDRLLVELGTLGNTTPNTDNPICVDVPRGVDYVLEGFDIDDIFFSETYTIPSPLSVSDMSVITVNNPTESVVTIEHSTGLTLMYNIDGGAWQISNVFHLAPDTSYTLNIKDEYDCEIAIPFVIDNEYYNEPQIVDRYSCSSLHELNVGKYLNLCGKQHTMKLGFVCNDQPNSIKIFKHIQIILNTDYAVKNVCIKTSQKQERFIPGTHMVYRIRESMHSVPLKNPNDFDDLRGSWAYIEIEIESIDNQKVDLFSVITHLRKSSI